MGTNGPAAIVACWEQLHEAVLELATRCATPRQRLLAVAERQLLAVTELGAKLDDRELREWISRLARRLQGANPRIGVAKKTECGDQVAALRMLLRRVRPPSSADYCGGTVGVSVGGSYS